MAIWYVDSARASVNLGTAVSGGVAAVDIYRLESDAVKENLYVWARAGQAVGSASLAAAQAEQSSDPVPAARSVAAGRSGITGAVIKDGTVQFADLASTVPAALAANPAMLGAFTAPGATNVSGAVTVDLSAVGVQVLTLTGNVTSFAFSNPAGAREEIEVHFVQDGTGSRTLAGVNASIKWAGAAAPTLSTTAGRRDIFRFRYIGGTYFEMSRSLNVG